MTQPFALLGFISLLSSLAFGAAPPASPSPVVNEEIKIGLMAPVTGSEAAEKAGIVNAATLAIQQVNREGGVKGRKFALVIEDTKSGPITAKEAYDSLLKQNVISVLAPYKSAQIVAMIPAMLKGATPTFIGGTSPRLTEDNKWFFRLRHDDTISAAAMVQYLKENTKFKKIGILHDNGAFGVGAANLAAKYLKDGGMTLTKRLGFEIGERNFEQPMNDMKAAGIEALIVFAANQVDGGSIAIPYAKIGKPFMYIASPSAVSKVALETAKGAAEGVYGIADLVYGTTDENKKYERDYKEEFKTEPDQQQAYFYDAVKIIAQSMKAVGENKEQMRSYILKLKNYKGVIGRYDFSPNGDGVHSVSVIKIHDGKPTFIKTVGSN